MQTSVPIIQREWIIDRNPIAVGISGGESAIVHGTPETLGTYTVPANRMAVIEQSYFTMIAHAAGTANYSNMNVQLKYTPNGGSVVTIHMINKYDVAIDDIVELYKDHDLFISAGDQVDIVATCALGGGKEIAATGLCSFTEFDA